MKRRKLRFETVEAILNDARRLMSAGYDRAGNWSLGQACEHLTRSIESNMDGFDFTVPWWMRIGAPLGRAMVLRWEWMPAGAPAPKRWVPSDPVDDAAGVDRIQVAIARYVTWDKPLHPSPLLGRLSREQWDELHRLHAAHHLGFLVPRGKPTASGLTSRSEVLD